VLDNRYYRRQSLAGPDKTMFARAAWIAQAGAVSRRGRIKRRRWQPVLEACGRFEVGTPRGRAFSDGS
jgi:hypothetical protein